MPYSCDRTLDGCKLRNLREKNELTQGQLAYLIGVRQPCIAKYEKRGVSNLWIVKRIADLFGMEIDDLL